MQIAVTGASGFLGRALVDDLTAGGHRVLRLVRHPPSSPDEVRWDPSPGGEVDTDGLRGTDAVVHLAAPGLGDRPWTAGYKRHVRQARVDGTRTLAAALATMAPVPALLVNVGAGYYGNPGDKVVDETDPAGSSYLARIVVEWEAAARPVADAGGRLVLMRCGVIVAPRGGAFARLLPLFRLGLGGRLGGGRQWWSWIALPDWLRAVRFLLDADLVGPVNLTAPEPATNAHLTAEVGRALHRPTLLPVPGFALRIPLRDFGDDLLRGQRVVPRRLLDSGFRFDYPDIAVAADYLAGRTVAPG